MLFTKHHFDILETRDPLIWSTCTSQICHETIIHSDNNRFIPEPPYFCLHNLWISPSSFRPSIPTFMMMSVRNVALIVSVVPADQLDKQ